MAGMLGTAARIWASVCAALAIAALAASGAAARDHSRIYSAQEIAADAERLKTAARKIFSLGLEPHLTADERARLPELRLAFPKPEAGDHLLDFYAYTYEGRQVVAMPLLSLKALEDLTTAYAWILSTGRHPGVIDLYYAMLTGAPAGGRAHPAILPALGVPADAWKRPPVDKLSLSLRNEAYAFILGHELAHLVYAHRGYDEITTAQARADEVEADRFALDLLARAKTPALGAALFFQAQAYSLPNRGQFESEQAWLEFQRSRSTHPLGTDRIRAFAAYMEEKLVQARPAERELWGVIGGGLKTVADTLDDPELAQCVVRAGRMARPEDLKPRRGPALELFARACG
ncbi:MAG: hypothetical protein AAFR16_08420 [Pseudomonadota bacterium]